MKAILRTLVLLFVSHCGTRALVAQEIRVAAASDLSSVLPLIAEQFEREHHCKVIVSYGSSGNFFQQLSNGAPFDVFLSADADYPQRLQQRGLTLGEPAEYARGQLVLWVRSGIAPPSGNLMTLTDEKVRKIAIANPQHAPYGKAAVSALQAAHIYEQVAPKLVLGENVSQAALFVQSGSADAGLLPLALAQTPALKKSGAFVLIAADGYPPIRQVAVALRASKQATLAAAFLSFLKSQLVQAQLHHAGFDTIK